jgi:hypothetical protein
MRLAIDAGPRRAEWLSGVGRDIFEKMSIMEVRQAIGTTAA